MLHMVQCDMLTCQIFLLTGNDYIFIKNILSKINLSYAAINEL